VTTVRTGKKREWDGISGPDPGGNRAYGAIAAILAESVIESKHQRGVIISHPARSKLFCSRAAVPPS
jgi:hypothetical protein